MLQKDIIWSFDWIIDCVALEKHFSAEVLSRASLELSFLGFVITSPSFGETHFGEIMWDETVYSNNA